MGRNHVLTKSLLVLLALVFVGPASAQEAPKANPESVTFKFENYRVRVLKSVLKPGA